MIEKFIETEGVDKGRVKDIDIAMELAYTEDAWREEGGDTAMLNPPERLGKPEVHFRDIVNNELKRLIIAKVTKEINHGFNSIYEDPAAKENDPENTDKGWMVYRVANKLASIGEEHSFDLDICNEILDMPFPEAFETAYSYLTRTGLDADSILADFIETQ